MRECVAVRWMLGVLTAIVVIVFLQLTYGITMPLAASVFVAASVWPIYAGVRRRMPRGLKWLGLVAALTTVLIAAGLFVGAIVLGFSFIAERTPQYVETIQGLLARVTDLATRQGLPLDRLGLADDGQQIVDWVSRYALAGLNSLGSLMGLSILLFFFTTMMLLEASRWEQKTRSAFSDERAWKIVEATRAVALKSRQYLYTQTLISLVSGALAGVYAWLLGVPMPLVWAMLFFVLNYIPNIGSTIAVVLSSLLTLATQGFAQSVVFLVGLLVLETLIGYGLQPLWQGKRLSISPLVVLLSVVLWGWVWGAVGAVLSVPLTVTLIIAFSHIEALRPLALLMSDETDERGLDRQTSS